MSAPTNLPEFVAEYLRENLRLDVETTSEYTGGMDGSGSLYTQRHTVQLVLAGEVISEVAL